MLAKLFDRIRESAGANIFEVNGITYSDKDLSLVGEKDWLPLGHKVPSLDAMVELIKHEMDRIEHKPIFVEVESEREVSVYTTYDDKFRRLMLYSTTAPRVGNTIGGWTDKEDVIIQLKAVYRPSEDVDYLLSVLSSISEESSVQTKDDGFSQTVEARRGVAMKEMVNVKPRVSLAPYRTFLEVEQPESDFILRLKEGAQVLIKEADGGKWKLEARRRIAEYLRTKLTDEIAAGSVVVTE